MSEERILNFQKLTPRDDVDLGVYADAIDKVFAEDDLKNIAISGAYSSGKSSVLDTYKKKHKEKRFLHISLAHFEKPKDENSDASPNTNENYFAESNDNKASDKQNEEKHFSTESILEGKILNQLIHQIDPAKILQTNFRIKQKISRTRTAINALLAVIASLAVLYSMFFKEWSDFIVSTGQGRVYSLFQFTTRPASRIGAIIFAIICMALFVYWLIILQKTKSIVKKISVKGTDIEILGENKDSYFDRYLNEVLYLFDNSKSDVIVFEDMDRFNANQIFERLREVNTLINNQREQRHDKWINALFMRHFRKNTSSYKPLRFFYLLRDDIFTTKDRTKFFDYIIPVVPVIDGSNSYDKFIEKFKEGGVYEKFDPHFLQKLSLYVDDMRLLLNIYNEFLVYEAQINSTEQDWNKMLAMTTYKNLFPRDFSELQLGRGYVHTVLDQKQTWIDKQIIIFTNSIDQKQKTIAQIENELTDSSAELLTIIKSNQLFKGNNYYSSYFSQVRLDQSHQSEYDRRNALLTAKADGQISILNREIEKISKSIETLQAKKFTEIAVESNSDEMFMVEYINPIGKPFSFNEIKENAYFPLLKFLLRFGWIDESYKDYMNYFYPNSLSVEDKTFLRSITDKKAKEPNYHLKDPEKILGYLSAFDLEQKESLNIFLIKYLLENQEKNQESLDAMFGFIIKEENYKIIVYYMGRLDASKELVNYINQHWASFLQGILNGKGYISDDFQNTACVNFVLSSLYHSSNEQIEAINIKDCLKENIQSDLKFLEFGQPNNGLRSKEPNIDMLIKRFNLLGVKFKSLNYESSNKELFQKVYEHDQYELNKENIWLMLKSRYGLEETANFVHRNLTIIMSDNKSPLANYVWGNIETYIKVIIACCDNAISDDEQVVLDVLNCDKKELDSEIKIAYLSVLKTKIVKLSTIDSNELWKKILEFDLCNNSQENILSYFEQHGLDDILVNFINNHKALSYKGFTFNSEKLRNEFFGAIITKNDIADDRYSLVVSSLALGYNKFSFENISKIKTDILIDNNTIRMNKDTLPFIRDNYPNNLMRYIEKNIKDYVTLMTEELFLLDEVLNVFKLNIADEYEISLLGFTDEHISMLNKGYTDAVKVYILDNNFLENDLSGIVTQYSSEADLVKAVIIKKVVENIDEVIENEISPPISLFDKLLSNTGLTAQNKLELFALIVNNLEKDQFRSYLPQLGIEYYERVFERGQPQIPNTPTHERILKILQRKGWISSYKEDDRDDNYFRAYGWKPHKDKKSK